MIGRRLFLLCMSSFLVACSKEVPLRGDRYCEVLVATLAAPNVRVDVYNTIGLSDCPDEAWTTLDANTIKNEQSGAEHSWCCSTDLAIGRSTRS